MTKEDNVVKFPVPPKHMNRSYKSHSYTVTYLPKTKRWQWTVTVVNRQTFSDEADTQIKAFRAAEKFIDKNCK